MKTTGDTKNPLSRTAGVTSNVSYDDCRRSRLIKQRSSDALSYLESRTLFTSNDSVTSFHLEHISITVYQPYRYQASNQDTVHSAPTSTTETVHLLPAKSIPFQQRQNPAMPAENLLRFASCQHAVDNTIHSITPFPEDPTIHLESMTITDPANCLPCTIQIALENTKVTLELYDGKIEETAVSQSERPWWTINPLQYQKDKDAQSRKNKEILEIWKGVGRKWNKATRASSTANSFNGIAGELESLAGVRLETDDGVLLGAKLHWRVKIGDGFGTFVGEEEILLRRKE